jgi:DNA-binding NtrC family response regulator
MFSPSPCPLRNRKDDIPDLVQHFTRKFADKIGKNILSISPAALEALKNHTWPGNIRELANVIERAVIHCEGSVLRLADQLEKRDEMIRTQTSRWKKSKDNISFASSNIPAG